MGKEAEIESVIPQNARESVEAAAPTEVQETEQRQCCRAGVCGLTEGKIAAGHLFAIRVIGCLTMTIAATEFGVGGTLFNYFDNVKLGAWWGRHPRLFCWCLLCCVREQGLGTCWPCYSMRCS